MEEQRKNFQFQKIIAITGISLFLLKMLAWYLTRSVAIMTDALESTINIITSFIGLYSLYLSAQPKDKNHPYGHGKAEFISAAVEGILIFIAGVVIIYESVLKLRYPSEVTQISSGLVLIGITALVNYIIGLIAIRKGKKSNSIALIAGGKHLQSDTYSTMGIIIGLLLMLFTGLNWLDSVVALLFAVFIIFSGYKIVRNSIAGIMDEADYQLLGRVVTLLDQHRSENWVDMHNLRIIKYGGILHLDCHLTVPWYLTVLEAHREVENLELLVRNNFGENVEMFVHTDPCMNFSCKICIKKDCDKRISPMEYHLKWTIENISSNKKHQL